MLEESKTYEEGEVEEAQDVLGEARSAVRRHVGSKALKPKQRRRIKSVHRLALVCGLVGAGAPPLRALPLPPSFPFPILRYPFPQQKNGAREKRPNISCLRKRDH